MSETTLTSPSTITPLQSMLHENYALRELFTHPSYTGNVAYTGSNTKITFDASFNVTAATNWSFSGTISATGAVSLNSTLAVTGAANFNGNVTIGDAAGDSLTVNAGSVSAPSGFNLSNNLSVGATKITQSLFISGNVTSATTVPINSANQLGGVMVFIRGADGAGVAFVRLYLVALRVNAGAAPDVSTATLVASAGASGPTFTFSNVSGFLNVTAASNNSAYVSTFGG